MSEVFSGRKGKFVNLPETLAGFKALLNGEGDEYPDTAFYMVGNFEEALEQGRELAREAAKK